MWGILLKELAGAGPLTKPEMDRLAYCGALGALWDHLYDNADPGLVKQRQAIISRPDQTTASTSVGKLFFSLYREMTALPFLHQAAFEQGWQECFRAQEKTLLQKRDGVLRETIMGICKAKGAWFTFLPRLLLDVPLAEPEAHTLRKVGELVQVIDDLNDIIQDTREGIRTIGTEFSVPEKADILYTQATETFGHLKRLPYAAENKNRFIFFFYGFTVGVNAFMAYVVKTCGPRISPEMLAELDRRGIRYARVGFKFLFKNFWTILRPVINYQFEAVDTLAHYRSFFPNPAGPG
jgi:hypothetical protein